MTTTRRIIISAPPIARARRLVTELLVSSLTRIGEREVKAPPDTVQSIVEVTLPATPFAVTPDFYDILDDGTTPTEGYVVSYEALYEDQKFTIIRDLFGPGDFPHNYGGWPVVGEPYS